MSEMLLIEREKTKRTAIGGLIALVAIALFVAGTKVVETGEPNADGWLLAAGEGVTVSDSMSGWQGVNAILVEVPSGGNAVVGMWQRSGWREIEFTAGTSTTLPVEFLQMNRIASKPATAQGDTVVKCVSGTARIFLVGG